MRWIPLIASFAVLAACEDLQDRAEREGVDAGRPRGAVVAKCTVTVGSVEVRRAGTDSWVPLAAGAEFERGDLVRTGKESFVSVKFKTGGGFDLEENGLMVISVQAAPASAAEPHKKVEQPLLALESGVGRGFIDDGDSLLVPLVIQEDDGSQVSLAAAGRGGVSFRLSKTARGTEVAVSQGKVLLSSKGKQIQVAEGQAADVAKGGSVSDVVELLDFPPSLSPGVDARLQCQPGLSIGLKWAKVAGAAGYRVQVARDLNFQSIVVSTSAAGTEASFSPPEAGTYAWRVAARDAQERTGEYGFARRIFCEQEAPKDLLLSPEATASYAYDADRPPKILFAWQSAGAAAGYRLVVAKQADLLATPPVVDLEVPEQRAEVSDLEIGEYYWGVYVGGAQPSPIFTTPRKLSVVKTLKTRFQTPKSISSWGKRK